MLWFCVCVSSLVWDRFVFIWLLDFWLVVCLVVVEFGYRGLLIYRFWIWDFGILILDLVLLMDIILVILLVCLIACALCVCVFWNFVVGWLVRLVFGMDLWSLFVVLSFVVGFRGLVLLYVDGSLLGCVWMFALWFTYDSWFFSLLNLLLIFTLRHRLI